MLRVNLRNRQCLQIFRSLIDLARGRFEDGTASLTSTLSSMLVDAGSHDAFVCDVLYRELCNAREQLHNFDEDYVKLAAKFKEKAAATSRPAHSSEYLESLKTFNDGRMWSSAENWTLQVHCYLSEPP